MDIFIALSFMLLFGHCLADAVLQPSSMSNGKRRNTPIDMSKVPPGQKPINLWYMWMTHHAVINGGVVAIITGRYELGILETVLHWIIDFFKCENKYSPNVDQALHLGCKLFYVILITSGVI